MDTGSEMPLAVVVEPANVNEKKTAPKLLRKACKHRRKVKHVVADTQYSSEAFREKVRRVGAEPVIPYPKNQRKNDKQILHVDKKFRSHGPWRLKKLYRRRSAIERVTARLTDHFGLEQLRTRGLRNVLTHTLLCLIAMLTVALSAHLLGYPDLIRSPVSLMKLTGKIWLCTKLARRAIEHLQDPVETLKETRRILNANGWVYILTPNISSVNSRILGSHWYQYKPNEHLSYFSPNSLSSLLHLCGFADVRLRSAGIYTDLGRISHVSRPTNPLLSKLFRAFHELGLDHTRVWIPSGHLAALARKGN